MGYEEKTGELMIRATEIMNNGLKHVGQFVNRNYMIDLDQYEPVAIDANQKYFSYITLFRISKIVHNRNENINDKLVSVYSALSNFGSTALLVLDSNEAGVTFYIGTRDTNQPGVAETILQKSLRGNFPGIEMYKQSASQVEQLLKNCIPEVYSYKTVSSVSIVPSPRDDDKEHFVQGLEKFIDSMSGENYTAIFISVPLSKTELETKKRGYEELYSVLSQCAQVNLTYSENDSEAVAKGISDTFATAINEGISNTIGVSNGTSEGVTKSRNHGNSHGMFGMAYSVGRTRTTAEGVSNSTSIGHTATYSETETIGKSISYTMTNTAGTTSTIAVTRQNKTIQGLLSRIDDQLIRIKNCESYGLWNSACYFIADKQETSVVAANTFKALVAGEKTSVENSFINIWSDDYDNSSNVLMLLEYLRYGLHPQFKYMPACNCDEEKYSEQIITPACLISGVELPVLMGLPHKSVNGVTSITVAEFGRNVLVRNAFQSYRNIDIGSVFHMGEVFAKNRVRLDLESLASHCFITGATGSGKSNTTYKIIDELVADRNRVNFLVIEPAKGEYKMAFGNMPKINIFSTNPSYYNMLRINPFEFCEQIHVLEHLDRLIEIFSACWPLYAAMPALLKASFEQAYINHGWDLNHSVYINRGNEKFPSFRDIIEILPALLEASDFSTQNKGDYIGALVTRVSSLTNGLIGQIFSEEAIADKILFDENTIVDLSRIGSIETKALLMGVLVLKLSEYRQSTAVSANCLLKHITILEEAHNLLKRTSVDQGQESSNVQGKSVEMISNSIAEMRTYGEGFVIVDQSPTAVDISAIKNTNTKIIMRLPEFNDCEAIGRSIGLNNDQILELSKLDKGVAAIYQNNWQEAVLTKVDKCSGQYETSSILLNDRRDQVSLVGELLAEIVAQEETNIFNMSWLNTILSSSKASDYIRAKYRKLLTGYQRKRETAENNRAFVELVSQLIDCNDLLRIFEDKLPPIVKNRGEISLEYRKKCKEWRNCIYNNLDAYANFPDKRTKDIVFKCVLLYKVGGGKKNMRYKQALYCIWR